MTVSPKKTPAKTITVNRGVEAKENRKCDMHEEVDQRRQCGADGDCQSTSLHSASYVQVLVQKHQRSSGRVPVASSPNNLCEENHTRLEQVPIVYQCQCGVRRQSQTEPSVFISCPALAALRHQSCNIVDEFHADGSGDGVAVPRLSDCTGKKQGKSFWNKLRNNEEIDEPDRVEVYLGERDCGLLYARSPAETCVERNTRALRRHAGMLCDELLAVPRLLLQMPISILLRVQSCLLVLVRGAVTDAVQTTSDQLWKPTLALIIDAALRPPLVCAARLATALRHAARPLWLTLGDAVAPLAHLLAQIRLVTIEYRWPCEHKCSCDHTV